MIELRWNLKAVLSTRSINAEQLFRRLGLNGTPLSYSQVCRLIAAPPKRLSWGTLLRLCRELRCTPADLIAVASVATPDGELPPLPEIP